MTALKLRALPQETWGNRLSRARELSGLSLRDAAAAVAQLVPTSYGMLRRLERLAAPPPDVNRRVVGYLALVAYGFNPEEFDLSADDLPRSITRERLGELVRSRCFRPFPLVAAALAV